MRAAMTEERMPGWSPPDRGALFVVSGPSGVGKSTLVKAALATIPALQFSVSATTRPPRPGEQDGVHYHFVAPDTFARWQQEGAFLEHAEVYDQRYGTLRGPTLQALSSGTSLLLDIDVQGARQIREALPEAVHIFVSPPTRESLRERLISRGTDDPQVIERRMNKATEQLRGCGSYDYVVVNDVLEQAHTVFQGILLAELSKTKRRPTLVERLASSD